MMIPREYGEHGRSSEYTGNREQSACLTQHRYWEAACVLASGSVVRVIGAFVAVLGMATASAQAAERVTTIPLGGSLAGQQSGDHYFGVYVPTRFGGELTIKTTSGKVVELKGPNGAERTNGQDIGLDQQGWYTFRVVGAEKPYTVETTFIQVGQSIKKPWNFYYWPTKADSIHEPWAGGNGRVDTD